MILLGVPFDFTGLRYYSYDEELPLESKVICDTAHGAYLGTVTKIKKVDEKELQKPNFSELFPKILRVANFEDLNEQEENEEFQKEVVNFTQREADKLKLEMTVLNCYTDMSVNKMLITFQSEGRIDFRALVKNLIGKYHVKIELRQIGPRDYASIVGGLGPCGLPLCCSTFLSSFDGISINMAKNQLLSLNIAKLSGQCGKLLCCLKYEDDAYVALKESFPNIGDKLYYKGSEYEITTMNYLSDTITCYNGSVYENFTRQEYKRAQAGIVKKEKEFADINSNVNLSGYGVEDTNNRLEQIKVSNSIREKEKKDLISQSNKPSNPNKNNKNNKNRNNHQNHNNQYHNKNNDRRHPPVKKESGFIPVSQIQDRSILETNKDDKE